MEVEKRVFDAPVLHHIVDVCVRTGDHPRRRPNGVPSAAQSGPWVTPAGLNFGHPFLGEGSTLHPFSKLEHGVPCGLNSSHVGYHHLACGRTLRQEGFHLSSVIFLTIGQHQIWTQGQHAVNVDFFGPANLPKVAECWVWPNAKFGLSDHLNVQVVHVLGPTRHQRDNAHLPKLVSYICNMTQPVRFAVVGCGHIGRRHMAMIEAHPEAELVAAVDTSWPSSEEMLHLESNNSSVQFFSNLDEALGAAGLELDVVAICTPNGSHVPLSLKVVQAGCHVVLEKPMGLTSEGVERLHAAAIAESVTVFGVMQNRFAPAAQWLKETKLGGGFGDVLQVHVQCLWNRDERYYKPGSWRGTMKEDGGPLFTQFSHFLDILMWVFGGIEVEEAHFVNQTHGDQIEFEDGGLVRFRFLDGGWGTFTFSTSAPHSNFESSMTVMGSRGTVRIGGQYMDRVDEFALPHCQCPDMGQAPPPNDYGGYQGSAANHHFVYDNVMDVLLRAKEVATPIEEGLAVVRAIEQMNALGRA